MGGPRGRLGRRALLAGAAATLGCAATTGSASKGASIIGAAGGEHWSVPYYGVPPLSMFVSRWTDPPHDIYADSPGGALFDPTWYEYRDVIGSPRRYRLGWLEVFWYGPRQSNLLVLR